MFPNGADHIPNPLGTAPGFQFKMKRCLFFFLPGVPSEMLRMLSAEVIPRILKTQGHSKAVSMVKTVSCFGITEAETGERLEALSSEFPAIKIGLHAKFPVIQIKLYLRAEDKQGIEDQAGEISQRIVERLGKYVFSVTAVRSVVNFINIPG